jgi:hypothetical protein
LRKEKKLNH